MKIVVNNTAKNKCKETMDLLLQCVKDKTISAQERKQYYSEYLQLSANYLQLSK
jgi:hypothetical protein